MRLKFGTGYRSKESVGKLLPWLAVSQAPFLVLSHLGETRARFPRHNDLYGALNSSLGIQLRSGSPYCLPQHASTDMSRFRHVHCLPQSATSPSPWPSTSKQLPRLPSHIDENPLSKEWERARDKKHAVERGTKGVKRERSPMQTRFPSAWEIWVGLGSIHAGVACRRHAGV
jgi:hypothetical protein